MSISGFEQVTWVHQPIQPDSVPSGTHPEDCMHQIGSEKIGAGNETRTRDPNLGKVVLYQLSYSRKQDTILTKSDPLSSIIFEILAMPF